MTMINEIKKKSHQVKREQGGRKMESEGCSQQEPGREREREKERGREREGAVFGGVKHKLCSHGV